MTNEGERMRRRVDSALDVSHFQEPFFCETCANTHQGSTQVEAKKFGDLTADHLITSDDREIDIDQSKVFRYVYPAARKTSHQCAMAFNHFVLERP